MAFSKQVIVFLYTYLRQADLSIDRARWTSWKELTNFYEDKLKPGQVIKILDSNAFKESSWLGRVIQKEFAITPSEYNILYATLLCYQELLDQPEPTTTQIGSCYSWIKYLAYDLLEPRLSQSDRNRVMHPEHYLENPLIKTTPLEELVDLKNLLKNVV